MPADEHNIMFNEYILCSHGFHSIFDGYDQENHKAHKGEG